MIFWQFDKKMILQFDKKMILQFHLTYLFLA